MTQRFTLHSKLVSSLFAALIVAIMSHAGEATNIIDANGLRQGYWKITGAISTEDGYRDSQIVEEGNYENSKKIGVWKKFYPSGSLRNEITFVNNIPRGPYKIYHPNGKLEEEGNWQGNKNIGAFKRYHKNGRLAQDFTFLSNGKRDGIQSYFYENGQPQLTVEIKEGTAHGHYKTFFADGKPKAEKMIVDGEIDDQSVKNYTSTRDHYEQIEAPKIPERIVSDTKNSITAVKQFERSGENTLYNHRKQITQVGEFRDGRLWNGNWNRYDQSGKLLKVEVYREGKFAGYGSIEEADK